MYGIGASELLIIGVIVMVLFGPRQLPKMGRALGETIREFRGVAKELHGEDTEVDRGSTR